MASYIGPLAWLMISIQVGIGFRIGWLLIDMLVAALTALISVVQSTGSNLLRWLFQ